jgi:MFS family permease
MLAPEQRGRLNGLFMTSVFVCGAAGSLLAAAVFAYAGWPGLSLLGAGFGTAALLFYFSEFRRPAVPAR